MGKPSCLMLAAMLHRFGVKHVVMSPGSRNAPLVTAFERNGHYTTKVVIDERSAAFISLGMSLTAREPVALVCTSGSALLNYAPAVAEAYYRRVPLIVISADRPAQWIGQDDSQTIVQPHALDNVVKYSCNLTDTLSAWHSNRLVNDAMASALMAPNGPVHINVEIDEPLAESEAAEEESQYSDRIIEIESHECVPSVDVSDYAGRRVMILAGFMPADAELDKALARLAARGVVVLTEAQSNLHVPGAIDRIDATLRMLKADERRHHMPEVVITMGGALLSRHVKQFMRDNPALDHRHLGHYPEAIDCFCRLTRRIEASPREWLGALADAMDRAEVTADMAYRTMWSELEVRAVKVHDDFCRTMPWCDFQAMRLLMRHLPRNINLHLSNGTAVRYAQLMPHAGFHDVECNRGVSGIDGCTSTALGAVFADETRPTVLITGDMSAQYDMGALATADIPPRFYMLVLNNGGGGIFRFVKSTASLPELERNFVGPVNLPLEHLAAAFNFRYLEASDEMALIDALMAMGQPSDRPTILNILTPGELSGDILTRYFR